MMIPAKMPSKVDEPSASSVDPMNNLENAYRDKYVTIPNIICVLRIAGSIWLFGLALQNNRTLFTAIFVCLSLSDWIDGRLARWLKQRSDFGARLDSFSDSVLYGGLFFGMFWLQAPIMAQERIWWIIGLLSYLLTTGAGIWKYGRIPSYHTYGAKISQWLVLVGAVCLLLNYSVLPFRIAMLGVMLTNLEATAMTWYLPTWRADVLSLLHILPRTSRK